MSMSKDFANALAKLLFNGTPIPGVAINATEAPLDGFYFALHTANPGATGTQGTSELAYPEYARVKVARTSVGWTVTDNLVRPAVAVEFPAMQAASGGGVVTHFSVGAQADGAGMVYARGTIEPVLTIARGDTPRLLPSTTLTLVADDVQGG